MGAGHHPGGVSAMAGHTYILSYVHTGEDVDKTVATLAQSLEAIIIEGSIKSKS